MKGKYLLLIATLIVTMSQLIGCTKQPAATAPALSGPSQQTGRLPSPSNFQRNQTMQSQRMQLPQQ